MPPAAATSVPKRAMAARRRASRPKEAGGLRYCITSALPLPATWNAMAG